MDPSELVAVFAGGGTIGGAISGLGVYYLRSRLAAVDRMASRLDRLIMYFRVKDPEFEKVWRDNGGSE